VFTVTNAGGVATNVLWNRLQAATEEMYDVAGRLAFSISIREWNDVATAVMDADARAVWMSKRSVPVLSGSISGSTQEIFDQYLDTAEVQPGDVIVTNDPWLGGGHLSDFVVITPVFFGGDLAGLVGAVGHVGDVGGLMGAWGTDAEDFYEEGLCVPPMKIYEGGEENEVLFEMLRANVRIPDRVIGDIEALVSANEVGATYYREALEEFGPATVDRVTADIIDRSESALRDAIGSVDDGVYEHVFPFSFDDQTLEIHSELTVDGRGLYLDFDGTSEQVRGGINCPVRNVVAIVGYVIKCFTIPEVPFSDGVLRPIEIAAPDRSLVNPTKPHGTDARSVTYSRVADSLIRIFGELFPEKALTESAQLQLFNFNGVVDDQSFVAVASAIGPFPARSLRDGLNAKLFTSNAKNVPIEVFEQYCPIRIVSTNLLPDSEGAGRFRSGFAQQIEFVNPTDRPINVSIVSRKADRPPAGLSGGYEGVAASVDKVNGEAETPENGRTVIEPGAKIVAHTASPGGFGDPRERSDEAIERDIRHGFLSADRAREIYGFDPSS
jgi:N-methylhydantoinase B/oxoprolinase/acetone carboxylase alpha subunit